MKLEIKSLSLFICTATPTFFFSNDLLSFNFLCFYVSCALLNSAGKEGKKIKGSGQATILCGVAITGSWPFSALSVTPTQVQLLETITSSTVFALSPLTSWLPKTPKKICQNLGRNLLCLWMPELPTTASISGYGSKVVSEETQWPNSGALSLGADVWLFPGHLPTQAFPHPSFLYFSTK